MQKAAGIVVLAVLGWADEAAYPDLNAYTKERFALDPWACSIKPCQSRNMAPKPRETEWIGDYKLV